MKSGKKGHCVPVVGNTYSQRVLKLVSIQGQTHPSCSHKGSHMRQTQPRDTSSDCWLRRKVRCMACERMLILTSFSTSSAYHLLKKIMFGSDVPRSTRNVLINSRNGNQYAPWLSWKMSMRKTNVFQVCGGRITSDGWRWMRARL